MKAWLERIVALSWGACGLIIMIWASQLWAATVVGLFMVIIGFDYWRTHQ